MSKRITVEAEPVKHGEWIDTEESKSLRYEIVRCSSCHRGFGKAIAESTYNYCPNCGARMVQDSSKNGSRLDGEK